MEFKKCSRCGNFYVSNGIVCPKCTPKDEFEFSTFKSYVDENGSGDSVDTISSRTGISVKNLNRFIEYNNETTGETTGGNGDIGNIVNNPSELKSDDNGITFLI